MSRGGKRLAGWIASGLVALFFLLPLIWMVHASFRPENRIFAGGFFGVLDFSDLHVGNYPAAWRRASMGRAMVVSLTQAAGIIGIGLLVNSLAAYAFARMDFRGKNPLFALVVALIILPVEVLAVPLFLTARDLGLTGGMAPTMGALILPFAAKAFNIYFLRQHFLSLPMELEEAARVDGASTFRIYWNIALPSIRPALATVIVLDVLTHWSDFIWPLIVCTREETRTVQIGLANLFTEPPIQYGHILAAAVIATLPVVLVFRLAQRHMVASQSNVGIK
ncbi:MAG: carbohydrate ABC transporter permease [Verrucomicrobia bacterium]|nr:carbohydrate ABC transporter permease [Verrucomicrobiota bacterium]MCH8511260.1 carbohydrate ABC transporter permease [Kiritimatiellia bacterium]